MMPDRTQSGFTLIELVVVLVIIAVASVPLFGLFSQASMSLLSNERIQTAAQLAQERAELILALKRSQGFAGAAPEIAVGTTNETLTGNFSSFTRDTVINQPLVPPSGCPAGATCREVQVSVSESGTPLSQLTFLLVNY
jgi:prepilin-type N-terminal cleavage/methylation domain-containing protein